MNNSVRYSIVIKLEDLPKGLNFTAGFYLDEWNIEKIKEYIEALKMELDIKYDMEILKNQYD